ncbi:MAG TPA: cytochrome P450 [Trebonia sp.]|nr:cytochrome P450 [Trebonia sp.]
MTDPGTGRLQDDYFQDPQRVFALMRESRPVTRVDLPRGRAWLVTRYTDVRAALADPRLAKDPRKMYPGWTPGPMQAMFNLHMLNLDPPDHTRLRRLVQKAFTPGRVAALRPRVRQIATELLDAVDDAGVRELDLLDAYAFPLPITVICELLGIPVRDRDSFRTWTSVLISSERSADDLSRDTFREAATAMFGYFAQLIAAKRESPADDLLSALILARDGGAGGGVGGAETSDALTENELYGMLFLLLVAGFETTVNLIASGTLALLTFPAEMARLRADPSLLPAAVEELLRYANPLNHATERFTVADLPVGDTVIPAGEWVTLVTSSANRDPGRFPDPDRLELSRDASGHLAFGHGMHYCLGAPLARLEGEVAIGALLARWPDLALAVPPAELRWRHSSLIHGLESLPVRLG